jgi:hypothetical protein
MGAAGCACSAELDIPAQCALASVARLKVRVPRHGTENVLVEMPESKDWKGEVVRPARSVVASNMAFSSRSTPVDVL